MPLVVFLVAIAIFSYHDLLVRLVISLGVAVFYFVLKGGCIYFTYSKIKTTTP